MLFDGLSEFVNKLLSMVNGQSEESVDNELHLIMDFCHAEVCSLWVINKNTKDKRDFISLKKRIQASTFTTGNAIDFVHEIGMNCLTSEIISRNQDEDKPYFSSHDLSKHLSFERLSDLLINYYVAIPIHNKEKTNVIAILFLYYKEVVNFFDSIAPIIDNVLSITLLNSVSSNKLSFLEDLVNNYKKHGQNLNIKRLFEPIVNGIIQKYIPCEGASFFLLDNDYTNWYRLTASTPILNVEPEQYHDQFYVFDEGLTGRCASDGVAVIYNNISNCKDKHIGKIKNITEHRGSTMLVVPILRPTDNNVIGIIRVVNKIHPENHNIIDYFTDFDIELMTFACHYLALGIDSYLGSEQTNMQILKLAHEFKSPATSIRGSSDRAFKHLKNDYFVKNSLPSYLQQIKLTSENLINMVEDSLFSYQNKEDNKPKVFSVCDLRQIVRQSKKAVISYARQENILFDSIIIHDFPRIAITVEEDKFISIFRNLFTNAIKYRKRDNDKEFCVRVSASENENTITITVEDYGIGIIPEDASRIFHKHYRSKKAYETSANGFGIGLFLVKSILDDYSATIEVSHLSNPTCFKIKLPISLKANY